jgi:hypothetical protein
MSPEISPVQSEVANQAEVRLQAIVERSGLAEKYHGVAFAALDHYQVNKLHHNQAHMFEVTEKVLDLFDEFGEIFDLTDEDRHALTLAALWLDADYHLPPDKAYATKESRSAHVFFSQITQEVEGGESWDTLLFAGKVASLIESTEPGRKVEYGTAAYLLNRADLNNLAGTREETALRSGKFFIEYLISQGKQATESAQDALDEHSDKLKQWCAETRYSLNALVTEKQLPRNTRTRIDTIAPHLVKEALKKMAQPTVSETDETKS